MNGVLNTELAQSERSSHAGLSLRVRGANRVSCYHCGETCADFTFTRDAKVFCCRGCLVVHDLLSEAGLEHFYRLSPHPGVRVSGARSRERWVCLDDPELQPQLLDFSGGKLSRITFPIPAIHCVSCVWLLENLFRLQAGIGRSTVDFARREATIDFAADKIKLSELATLLASIGYEPALTLGEVGKQKPRSLRKRQWVQVGLAGFAFGNIMLFSLPVYFGLDTFNAPVFRNLFGYLSLALALPVLLYSASDYWKSARLSVRQRVLTLDVPIAMGLAALYVQSAWEILSGRGPGYLDSLVALVLFLLCGRAFQQKIHDRLAFDRDFKSFFPLSVMRRTGGGEESVAISQLRVGDRVVLRHGELIPADAKLAGGPALIDYSFVTGECEPVPKKDGDYLYAGGKQVGGSIDLETVKPVSQSYLASLWNHDTFRKDQHRTLETLTNRYSRRFTMVVVGVALAAAAAWLFSGDASRGIKALTSVLIVACPCALALAAPFTLGTGQRLLARIGCFVRNALVLENLARVDAIVFDKTGTLTSAKAGDVQWADGDSGPPLTEVEANWVHSLAHHSTHPHCRRIWQGLPGGLSATVNSFKETPGCGIEGLAGGHHIRLGSRSWLETCGVPVAQAPLPAGDGGILPPVGAPGSDVHLAIDGRYRGSFRLPGRLRPEIERLLQHLHHHYELALLSGDNEKERATFGGLFAGNSRLNFNQTPLDKLDFIQRLQHSGKTVMMVGDGLNDAGALKQSDVGVAIVEKIGAFSPSSDVILDGSQVPRLDQLLAFARASARIVRLSFGISACYNLAGITVAAAGMLSPLICAILMPLSSISIVCFACAATNLAARRIGLANPRPHSIEEEAVSAEFQPAF